MFPADFIDELKRTCSARDVEAILASMRTTKAIGLWENPLLAGAAPSDASGSTGTQQPGAAITQLCQELQLGGPVAVSSALPGCYRVPAGQRDAVMHHELVVSGRIYPMNPSSLLAATALQVQPGDEVLDLAAAPGGKSLVLAAALARDGAASGRLALVEPVKARFHRLRANMERCGVAAAHFYQRDGRGVGMAVPERFDRVLLDAPCSSEARFQLAEPDSMRHWSLRKVRECARKQKSLLKSAFRALKPGGTLIYSTCSFAFAENERIVDGLLRREPQAQLVPVTIAANIAGRVRAGVTQMGKKTYACADAVRVVPDELWDGFFLAKIIKRPSAEPTTLA